MRLTRLLLALSASQLALASDWTPIPGTTPQGDEILVDTDSITDSVLGRKVWIKYKYAKPQKIDAAVDKKAVGKEYSESISLSRFDCDQRTMTPLQVTFRDANGEVVSTEGSPSMQMKMDVPPDTVGEAIMNFVCRWKAPEKP
jgi:hypothetical protein